MIAQSISQLLNPENVFFVSMLDDYYIIYSSVLCRRSHAKYSRAYYRYSAFYSMIIEPANTE